MLQHRIAEIIIMLCSGSSQTAAPRKCFGLVLVKKMAAMDDMDKAIVDVTNDITKVLSECKKSGQVVVAWGKLQDVLGKQPALMWKARVPPRFVGCSSENRGGMGFMASTAISNGVKHLDAGYSLCLADQGNWCTQVAQQDMESAKFNNSLSDKQGLPHLLQTQVQTWGGTHQNVFLRCVLGEVEYYHPKWAPSGNFDPQHLIKEVPDLGKVLKDGLEYSIISSRLVKKFPEVVHIGSKALNIKGTAEISELEGMLHFSQAYGAALQSGSSEKDAAATAIAELHKIEPFWNGWAKSVGDFSKCVAKEQLIEAVGIKGIIPVPVGMGPTYGHVGGAFLSKLANLTFMKTLSSMPRLRLAAYLAQLYSPLDKVIDGKYGFLNTSDLTKLSTKALADIAMEAENILSAARDEVKVAEIPQKLKSQVILDLDASVIYIMIGGKMKMSRINSQAKTVQACYKIFQNTLAAHIFALTGEGDPCKHDPSCDEIYDEHNAAALACVGNSVEHLSSGLVHVSALGYTVGAFVKFVLKAKGGASHSTKMLWKVASMNNEFANLTPTGSEAPNVDPVSVSLLELKETWALQKAPVEQHLMDISSFQFTTGMKLEFAKAKVLMVMCEQANELLSLDQFQIWGNPVMVKSKVKFTKGALKIPYITSSMRFEKVDPRVTFLGAWKPAINQLGDIFEMGGQKYACTLGAPPKFNSLFSIIPKAEPGSSNLQFSFLKAGDIRIPMLINSTVIKPGDELTKQFCISPTANKRKASDSLDAD